jgi:hypothetical protein
VSCPGHSIPSVETLISLLLSWTLPSSAVSTLYQGWKCGQPEHITATYHICPKASANKSTVKCVQHTTTSMPGLHCRKLWPHAGQSYGAELSTMVP